MEKTPLELINETSQYMKPGSKVRVIDTAGIWPLGAEYEVAERFIGAHGTFIKLVGLPAALPAASFQEVK